MKRENIAYLCDGEACTKMCKNLTPEERAKHPCKHTLKEEHAKNKIRRERKFKMVKGGFVEVE